MNDEPEVTPISEKLKEPADAYKILLDTRKFEIENFWKRALFFWGFITVIAGGYASGKIDQQYLIIFSYLGFLFSLIFSLSTRGSKYWQEHWEIMIEEHEKANGFTLFDENRKDEIQRRNKPVFPLLRPSRLSVSKLVMILSDLITVVWAGVAIRDSISAFQVYCEHAYCCRSNCCTFPVAFAALIFLLISLLYIYQATKHKK